MGTRPVRPATQIQTIVGLDPKVAAALRSHLAEVADSAVLTIIDEVPSYAGAWSGRMGEVIRNAVQLALGGFLTLATRQDADAADAPVQRAPLLHEPVEVHRLVGAVEAADPQVHDAYTDLPPVVAGSGDRRAEQGQGA